MWNSDSVEDELRRNSLDYGLGVNSDRSIPDAKSGLKPVARRILYDAFITGAISSKPHVKSARVVGDTMGRLHPHGDSSIYGAMMRLSQNWVMRYPLIDVHGNNGNILGDGPAASRYTEARLTKLSEDGLLKNIKKGVVDTMPNYDETEEEPITLPAIFPNLLCNPNEGIGWAMGCSWAPHNLNEVAAAINEVLDGGNPQFLAPDFPTGGVIINKDDIPAIVKTGKGTVKVRGRYKIEKQNIVFYEIPYGTRLESLMEEIGKFSDEGKLAHISDIRNETGKKGLRLVIQVERGTNPESVVLSLFNKTSLQSNFSYNQVALIDKTPTELNLRGAINIYINHNLDCIRREIRFDLTRAENRLHIVEGLLIALEDINNIIDLIKKSESATVAQQNLIEKYKLSETQAKAILDMKLARLAKLEKVELESEKSELTNTITNLKDILTREERQKEILKTRLAEVVKKYGDARRTDVLQLELPKEEKEIAEVVPEDVVVVASKSGLIKKIPLSNFKVQRKGGRGVKSQDDILLDVIKTNTVDTVMFFTSSGKMYRTIVDNIPSGTNVTKGVSINSLVKLADNESVVAVTSLHRKTTPQFVIFITKNGMIKKTYLEEYTKTNRNSGIAALTVKEGDEVVDIIFQDEEEMLLITKNGMSLRFTTKDIAPIGRIAAGVRGIKLNGSDEIIAALPIHKDSDRVAVFSTNGLAKKVELKEFPIQGRNGKGTIVYKVSEQTGILVGAAMVSDNDNILICGNNTSLCISATDIPTIGKTGMGNIMMKNNRVISITKV
jgi:DNA gyrase subunit A